MTPLLDPDFEPVLTWPDYYDGPRRGVAIFRGRPHRFIAEADPVHGFADTFLLDPIDPYSLSVAERLWSIWRRWAASKTSEPVADDEVHVLPADQVEFAALTPLFENAMRLESTNPVRAKATFELVPETVQRRPGAASLRVKWFIVDEIATAPNPATFEDL